MRGNTSRLLCVKAVGEPVLLQVLGLWLRGWMMTERSPSWLRSVCLLIYARLYANLEW